MFSHLNFYREDFFYNVHETAEREKRGRLSLIKNELLICVILDFQCNQTFDIFLKHTKLISNAKCTKKIYIYI